MVAPPSVVGLEALGSEVDLMARRWDRTPEENRARSSRQRDMRARTENLKRLPMFRRARLKDDDGNYWRPTVRGECLGVPRPCPFVGCRQNLYLDVLPSGNLKLNYPDIEPDGMGESCALDVAERGGVTLDGLAPLLNVTRERVRQIINACKPKLKGSGLHALV